MTGPSQEYLASHVETASAGQLVVILYDRALRALERAKCAAGTPGSALRRTEGAVERDRPTQRFEEITNNVAIARRILTELLMALDFSQGILPKKLFALYSYMSRRLSDALRPDGKGVIEEVVGMLSELRGAWAEACGVEPTSPRELAACSVDLLG